MAPALSGDECRSWADHRVMVARTPQHPGTAPAHSSRPAAPALVTHAVDPAVHPDASGFSESAPVSVIKLISRISPPQLGHASGNSSPTRASSFAQAIRDVSWWQGFPSTVPAEPQQPLPAASETPSCSPFFASRCLPIFPTASAVTAGRRGWFGANTP
jgi:hypothetical protein